MAGYSLTDRYVLDPTGRFADRKPEEGASYVVYPSREGDTFEQLASKFLSNPTLYWRIADINPHVEWPDRIPTGTSIRIPLL